jgi:putative DNA modification/repair radical SAM protein
MNELDNKVQILAMGAKYDVSCSCSGGKTKAKAGGLGSCVPAGICHAFTADGRCVSLLKILQSNFCEYDCLYCVNRKSNNIPRARLSPKELADLTVAFYKRNYIEGLFLSSAVDGNPNKTMENMTEVCKLLRFEHNFRGYIHLKAIPGADASLIEYASRFADRMSVNIELPTEKSLSLLAPQKKKELIVSPMRQLSNIYIGEREERKIKRIPAGQSTQMIVGASPESDGQIVRLSEALYKNFALRRVFYSAYVPINDNSNLPALPVDLKREHRLYEADWLLRFYGFNAEELIPNGINFNLSFDVKTDWALRNIEKFPLEINKADYEMLLRIPGVGVKNAARIADARTHGKLNIDTLKKLKVALNRAKHFITVDGKYYGGKLEPDYIAKTLLGETANETEQMRFHL